MNNLYLIGMRGTGKTTIGRMLAQRLGKEFIDMDQYLIEKVGKTVPEIVEAEGWDGFREHERQVTADLSAKDDTIVSTGGGVLMFFDNGEVLKQSGTLVHLRATPGTIVERISSSEDRPSLTGKDFLEEIAEVWQARKAVYEKYADIDIDTEGKEPEEVLQALLSELSD